MANCSGRPRDLLKLKNDESFFEDIANTTSPTVLRTRIQQQSDLIMLLKNHNNAVTKENKKLQANLRIEEHKALVCQSSERKEQVREELVQVQERFDVLAAHHEELIVIKDEHKAEKKALFEKCKGLQVEIQIAESRWVAAHKAEIEGLNRLLDEQTQLSHKYFDELVALRRELERSKKYSKAEGAVSEAAAIAMRDRCAELEKNYRVLESTMSKATTHLKDQLAAITNQKSSLTKICAAKDSDLAYCQEQLTSERQRTEVHKLQTLGALKQVENLEANVRQLEEEKLQLLNRDIDGELADLQKEYIAHKLYSRKQLEHEQQVIKRLRMLQEA